MIVSMDSSLVVPLGILKEEGRETVVCAQQENILVSAFHPELTDDIRFHKYFVQLVRTKKDGNYD